MDIKKHISRKSKPLGAGWYRSVFRHGNDSSLVIKVAHRHLCGRVNRMEWEVWLNAPNEIKKWLVPCVSIHEDGAYLVMKRGKPARAVPAGFPFLHIIPDAKKAENWVKIGNKTLLADYGESETHKKLCKK